MKKTNKSRTVSLSVEYMLIHTTKDSTNALVLADDDIYATEWLYENGYKARVEGNTLVISKNYGWGKVEHRYVIIPNVEYRNYREHRNYAVGIEVAKRFAMAHTLAVIRKINAGL